MSRRIHLPKPTTGISVVDELPLFCGAKRDADTWTTCFEHRATCEACIKANRLYQEDLDYRRTQERLRGERERAARAEQDEPEMDDGAVEQPSVFRGGGAVHFSKDTPGSTGKVRGRCGVWSTKYSSDPAQVSCLRCMTMTRRRALIAAAALAAAACGPLPPEPIPIGVETGDTVTTSEDNDGSTTDVDSESSGEAGTTTTTSEVDSTTSSESTTDDASSTTGDGCVEVTCIGSACNEGEACRPHPRTGEWSCVAPCTLGVGCEVELCNGEAAFGVCAPEPNGMAWCFPS